MMKTTDVRLTNGQKAKTMKEILDALTQVRIEQVRQEEAAKRQEEAIKRQEKSIEEQRVAIGRIDTKLNDLTIEVGRMSQQIISHFEGRRASRANLWIQLGIMAGAGMGAFIATAAFYKQRQQIPAAPSPLSSPGFGNR